MLVVAIVSESTIEAFAESILHRFAGLDEIELHAGPLRPQEHCIAYELRAIVKNNLPREAVLATKDIQKCRQPPAEDRCIHQLADTLAGVIIHNIKGAEAPASCQLIRYKIQRPPLCLP